MVTQKQIAAAVGMARSTVSAALNDVYREGGDRIPEEKRAFIKKTAKEMGYKVDDMARAIKTGKTKVIGLVSEWHSSDFLKGISTEVNKRGYFLKLLSLDDKLVENCISQRLSGVIFHNASQIIKEYAKELYKHRIHVAAVGCSDIKQHCVHVETDNIHGMLLGLGYLYKQAHRDIALVVGTMDDDITMRQRCKVYKQFMKEKKLKARIIAMETPDYYKQYKYVTNTLSPLLDDKKNRPTAIFFACSILAINCICAMQQKSINDISLVSFGMDDRAVSYLTYIDEQRQQVGIRVSGLLIDAIENNSFEYHRELFPPILKQGFSVSKINN